MLAHDEEKQCFVTYVSDFIESSRADAILKYVLELDKQKFTGLTNRASYWYSNHQYAYGSTFHSPCATDNPMLNELLKDVSRFLNVNFNSILLNLYYDGNDHMPYHADDEQSILCQKIASLSIGATRLFSFLPKYDTETSHHTYLKSGSLLIMDGNTQKFWVHSLVKEPHVQLPRLNLTFRVIKPASR